MPSLASTLSFYVYYRILFKNCSNPEFSKRKLKFYKIFPSFLLFTSTIPAWLVSSFSILFLNSYYWILFKNYSNFKKYSLRKNFYNTGILVNSKFCKYKSTLKICPISSFCQTCYCPNIKIQIAPFSKLLNFTLNLLIQIYFP